MYRSITDSQVFNNPDLLRVWVWCLTKATHCDYQQVVGMQIVELKKGQFVYGRKQASKELGISESKFRNLMIMLEKLGNITRKPTNKFTIATVVNWEVYQDDEQLINQQNHQQGHRQEVLQENQTNATNKNIKNIKNNKNIKKDSTQPKALADVPSIITIITNTGDEFPIVQKDVDLWKSCYPNVDVLQELRKMKAWSYNNPTRRKTKSGMKRFINNWLSKEQDKGSSNVKPVIKPPQFKEFAPDPKVDAVPMPDAIREKLKGLF